MEANIALNEQMNSYILFILLIIILGYFISKARDTPWLYLSKKIKLNFIL